VYNIGPRDRTIDLDAAISTQEEVDPSFDHGSVRDGRRQQAGRHGRRTVHVLEAAAGDTRYDLPARLWSTTGTKSDTSV
jgi:hypothetical protein